MESAATEDRGRTYILLLVFFASGAAGVGYQAVWAKMFANGLGHEMPAVLATICAFMAGMARGAVLTARAAAKTHSPWRMYAGLELLIGAWGILSCFLAPVANAVALRTIGVEPSPLRHWTLAFFIPFLTLLPATAAMGATFAVMERLLAAVSARGHSLGALYAGNTAGAVAGVLTSTFVLMPALGLRSAALCLAALNFACAIAALFFRNEVSDGARAGRPNPASAGSLTSRRLYFTVMSTGMLGIGLEVAGTRVLAQVLENTVFTFAAVLAVYLICTAIGAAWYQSFGTRFEATVLLLNLLSGICFATTLSIFMLVMAQGLYDQSRRLCGIACAEIIVAFCVFATPTVLLGALFSHLFQSAKAAGAALGNVFALNSLGSALAPLIISVLLFPWAGSKWTLIAISSGYLLLMPKVQAWRLAVVVTAVMLPIGLSRSDFQLIQRPLGGSVIEYREGVMASVAVVKDVLGARTLRVNNRFQMGGTSAAQAEYRQGHIPLLLHPAPKAALFLGVGTGITFAAANLYESLEADGVELLPEVLDVLPQFAPYNSFSNVQMRLHVADARRWVRTTPQTYDVIIADLFHPSRDGAGMLYTREHFESIRGRLNAGGIFCQWLPLHQMDTDTLRIIVRTFLGIFPQAQAYLLQFNVDVPVLGLVGAPKWPTFSGNWIEARLNNSRLQARLKELSVADSIRFFGHFVGGSEFLKRFAGPGRLNTDDYQWVTFRAPLFSYQSKGGAVAPPYQTLFSLLQESDPRSIAEIGFDADSALRLAQFILARNIYLQGLAHESQQHETEAIDAYVESARISPDFTAGYAQCLSKASLWANEHPERAKALLRRLIQAQPERSVAGELLRRLEEAQ